MSEYQISLSDYEIANLRALIETFGYNSPNIVPNPFFVANTGDWCGQIYHKLPIVNHPPNVSSDELAKRANIWAIEHLSIKKYDNK